MGGMAHQQMMIHHVELVQQQFVVRRQALHMQVRLIRQEWVDPGEEVRTGFSFLDKWHRTVTVRECATAKVTHPPIHPPLRTHTLPRSGEARRVRRSERVCLLSPAVVGPISRVRCSCPSRASLSTRSVSLPLC